MSLRARLFSGAAEEAGARAPGAPIGELSCVCNFVTYRFKLSASTRSGGGAGFVEAALVVCTSYRRVRTWFRWGGFRKFNAPKAGTWFPEFQIDVAAGRTTKTALPYDLSDNLFPLFLFVRKSSWPSATPAERRIPAPFSKTRTVCVLR